MVKLWEVWDIEEKIGQGSFGEVFKAHKKELGKDYYSAIKHISLPKTQDEISEVIHEGYATTSEDILEYYQDTIDDLVKEIKIMYELRANQNIVDYQDHLIVEKKDGEVGFDIFIRMELLTSLDKYLENKEITEETVIKLGLDITTALSVCNKHNLLHRDIKPANIFVDSNGIYKLGDFGVARKLEKTTYGMSKKGTYNYMSPEIYKGGNANISSDIYSLGIVMYRLLNNNKAPFIDKDKKVLKLSDSEQALMRRMNGEELPDIENIDKNLMEIIKKACAYDRKNRYKDPLEMKKDLEKVLNGETLEEDDYEKTVSIYKDKKDNVEDLLDKTVSIYKKENEENPNHDVNNYTTDEQLREKIRKIMAEETTNGSVKNDTKYVSIKTYKQKSNKLFVALSTLICFILLIVNIISISKSYPFKSINKTLSSSSEIIKYFQNYYSILIITDVIVFISYLISLFSRKAQKIASYGYLLNLVILIITYIELYNNNYRVTIIYYLFIILNLVLFLNDYKWKLNVVSEEVKESEKELREQLDQSLEQSYKKKFFSKKFKAIVFPIISILLILTSVLNMNEMTTQSNDIDKSKKQIEIKEEYIKIRKDASTNSDRIGTVYKGETYTVIDEQEGYNRYNENIIWYHIKTNLDVEGYIASSKDEPWVKIISEGR